MSAAALIISQGGALAVGLEVGGVVLMVVGLTGGEITIWTFGGIGGMAGALTWQTSCFCALGTPHP
jgi:hypothetical protein